MFNGRVSVADYWKAMSINIAATITLYAGVYFVQGIDHPAIYLLSLIVLAVSFLFFTVVPTGLAVRRLHDLNHSGWWILLFYLLQFIIQSHVTFPQLLPVVVLVLIVASLYVSFYPGKNETNTHGPRLRYASWWGALIGKDGLPVVSNSLVSSKAPRKKILSLKGILAGTLINVFPGALVYYTLLYVLFLNSEVSPLSEEFTTYTLSFPIMYPWLYQLFNVPAILFAVLAGYVAARLATRYELLNSALTSWFCVLSVLITVFIVPQYLIPYPLWAAIPVIALNILLPILGGLIFFRTRTSDK